mgnify:CR=1 FL=1
MSETDILAGHFRDLASRSYNQNLYTFTCFLGEAQTDLLLSMEKELSYAGMELFGGTEYADRKIARFGRESVLGYSQDYPITCLKIDQPHDKYREVLSHRDYLGALMNLGIERELLGDILITESAAWLFCIDRISDFIIQNLLRVRHSIVQLTRIAQLPEELHPVFQELQVIVSSERLDGIISRLYHLSRSQSQALFHAGKVFINGRQCDHSSVLCKNGDRISVRGFGKFIYRGQAGITGKGRSRITLQVYS